MLLPANEKSALLYTRLLRPIKTFHSPYKSCALMVHGYRLMMLSTTLLFACLSLFQFTIHGATFKPTPYVPELAPSVSLFSRIRKINSNSSPIQDILNDFDIRKLAAWNLRTSTLESGEYADVILTFNKPKVPKGSQSLPTKRTFFAFTKLDDLDVFWRRLSTDFIPIKKLYAIGIHQKNIKGVRSGSIVLFFDASLHTSIIKKYIQNHLAPLAASLFQNSTFDLKVYNHVRDSFLASIALPSKNSFPKWTAMIDSPRIQNNFNKKDKQPFNVILNKFTSSKIDPAQYDPVVKDLTKIIIEQASNFLKKPQSPSTIQLFGYGSIPFDAFVDGSDYDGFAMVPEDLDANKFLQHLKNYLEWTNLGTEITLIPFRKMISMKFKGLDFDISLGNYIGDKIPKNFDILSSKSDKLFKTLPSGLFGVRNTEGLIKLIPKGARKNFSSLLKLLKLWAVGRGIYQNSTYLGGIALAILSAFVIRKNPENISIKQLIPKFFETMANYDWSKPIDLSGNWKDKLKNPEKYPFRVHKLSGEKVEDTIIARNMQHTNLRFIREEFTRAAKVVALLKDPQYSSADVLSYLCQKTDFLQRYPGYLEIKFFLKDEEMASSLAKITSSNMQNLLIEFEKLKMRVATLDKPISNPFNQNTKMHSFSLYVGIENTNAKLTKMVNKFVESYARRYSRHFKYIFKYRIVKASELDENVVDWHDLAPKVPLKGTNIKSLVIQNSLPPLNKVLPVTGYATSLVYDNGQKHSGAFIASFEVRHAQKPYSDIQVQFASRLFKSSSLKSLVRLELLKTKNANVSIMNLYSNDLDKTSMTTLIKNVLKSLVINMPNNIKWIKTEDKHKHKILLKRELPRSKKNQIKQSKKKQPQIQNPEVVTINRGVASNLLLPPNNLSTLVASNDSSKKNPSKEPTESTLPSPIKEPSTIKNSAFRMRAGTVSMAALSLCSLILAF